jgi:hypothetical protein
VAPCPEPSADTASMDEPGPLATAPVPTQDVTAPSGVLGIVRASGRGSGASPADEAEPGPLRAAPPGDVRAVEEQLLRLEARLVAEADGDPAGQRDARRLMALSRARFRGATIQTFLPILIERDVRRRLSGG